MKKLFTLLLVVALAGPAFATVKFNTGMSYNMFNDSRITGMSQGMGFTYMVGEWEAGWLWDTAILTATDATDTSVHLITQTVDVMRIGRVLRKGICVGMEVGQLTLATVAASTIAQAVPITGLFGTYSYETKGKDVTTALSTTVGLRMANIAAGVPAGAWGDTAITNINALSVSIAVTIGF